MAGEAKPVKVPTPGTFLGVFHIRKFNISKDDNRKEYERIRTLANQMSSGIIIENVHDLTETTETTDPDGSRVRQDRWYIVVSWWEKEAQDPKSPPKAEDGFYLERVAGNGR